MRSVKIHESQVLVVQTVYWRDILQMYGPSKLVSQEETCPYNFLHKRKGRFCKPRPSKQVSKLHKWKSSKKVEVCKTSFFKQVGFSCCKKGQWRYATALRPKSGLPLPPREKLEPKWLRRVLLFTPPHALSTVLVEEAPGFRAFSTWLLSFFSLVTIWHTARAILSGSSSWSNGQGHSGNQASKRTKQQTSKRQIHSNWAHRTEN